jgi:hypothetical protein
VPSPAFFASVADKGLTSEMAWPSGGQGEGVDSPERARIFNRQFKAETKKRARLPRQVPCGRFTSESAGGRKG